MTLTNTERKHEALRLIAELRERRGLTIPAISAFSKIPERTIQRWLYTPNCPSQRVLDRLSVVAQGDELDSRRRRVEQYARLVETRGYVFEEEPCPSA